MIQSMDIRTVLLLGAFISLLLAGVMIYFSLARKTYPGFDAWTTGFVSIGFGTVLLSMRGTLPDFITIILANGMVAAMPLTLARGMEAFVGLANKRRYGDYVVFLLFFSVFLWATYGSPSIYLRVICVCLVMLLYFGEALYLSVFSLPSVLGERNRLLVFMLSFAMVSMLIRIGLSLEAGEGLRFLDNPAAGHVAALILTVLSVIGIMCSLIILNTHRIEKELREAHRAVKSIANRDALTSLYNRRYFDRALAKEFSRHQRSRSPLSLIMADIDFFKNYNDTYGHQAGDECLRSIAEIFRRAGGRITDLASRYGGEEFVMILPETDAAGVRKIADMILNYVRKMAMEHESSSVSEIVTVSLGLVTAVPNREMRPEDLVNAADKALYESKRGGRNQLREGVLD